MARDLPGAGVRILLLVALGMAGLVAWAFSRPADGEQEAACIGADGKPVADADTTTASSPGSNPRTEPCAPRELRIVRGTEHWPAPGARAWLLPEGAELESLSPFELWDAASDAQELPSADADGRVPLPERCGGRAVVAADGDSWGARNVSCDGDGPCECVVSPTRWLVARLVGADGAPAEGVPVRLCETDCERASLKWWCSTNSDQSGIARFPLGEVDLEATLRDGIWLCAGLVGTEDVQRSVRPEELCGEIEFRLPPRGTLEIELVGEDGRPAPVAGLGIPCLRVCRGRNLLRELAIDGSRARLRNVLAASEPLTLELGDGSIAGLVGSGELPLVDHEGAVARHIAVVNAQRAWVTGKIVLAEGRKLPARALELGVTFRAGGGHNANLADDGSFRTPWWCDEEAQFMRLMLEIPAEVDPCRPRYEATVELGSLHPGQVLQLGPVTLAHIYDRGPSEPRPPPPPVLRFAYTGDPILRFSDLVFEWRPAGTVAWERACWEIEADRLTTPIDWCVRLAFTGEVLEQRSGWRPPKHATSISIDLRGKVHAHRVETTDDQGAPFAAEVWRPDPSYGPEEREQCKRSWTGTVCILTAAEETDVVVCENLAGFAPQRVRCRGPLTRVRLARGHAMPVRLVTPLASMTIVLEGRCTGAFDAGEVSPPGTAWRLELPPGECKGSVIVPVLGRYAVRCVLHRDRDSAELEGELPVDARLPGGLLSIELPAPELARARAAIEEK